jgi:hypothetical protein
MSELTPCFVALCKCGGWIAVAVDEPRYIKHNAKEVASWIRDGLIVEKRTVGQIRTGEGMCECRRDKQKGLFT